MEFQYPIRECDLRALVADWTTEIRELIDSITGIYQESGKQIKNIVSEELELNGYDIRSMLIMKNMWPEYPPIELPKDFAELIEQGHKARRAAMKLTQALHMIYVRTCD